MASNTSILSGLGSGLDTQSIVSGLVAVEQQPIDALGKTIGSIQSATQTISTISSQLSSLQAAAKALSTSLGFASVSATSSATGVAATASGAALPGSYQIVVGKLAQEQRTWADPQSSSTSALGMAGTLGIAIGSTTTDVTVAATDTLADVATKISSSGARVSASVIYDGNGYHLQVRGLDTGAANAVTYSENGLSLGLSNPANTYQSAQDAALTVDGLAITRPTNQVQGAVPGVTLALAATTSSTVTVANDPTSLASKIKTFVTAYNAALASEHGAVGYGSTKASNKTLAGDSTLRRGFDSLAAIVASAVPGATGAYRSLGSVGLKANADGTLALDTDKLTAAMTSDPTAVSRLFVTDPSIGATGAMASFSTAIDRLATGTSAALSTKNKAFAAQIKTLQARQTAMQDRLTSYQTMLQKQFAALDTVSTSYSNQIKYLTALSSSSSSNT